MDDILVDIKCHIPGHEDQTFGVATSENNTTVGLIRKLCKENKIPMKTSYVLQDSSGHVLPWSRTMKQSNIGHGATLTISVQEDDVQMLSGCSWNTWWFVAAICLLIGGIGITAISVLLTKNGEPTYEFGVVMDAGSSHTKLFVYKWDGSKQQETAVAAQTHICSVNGSGISSYADDPTKLEAPLTQCLVSAQSHVPSDRHKNTPVFLGATAGMRMLSIVNKTASNNIFKSVRRAIKKSPFMFKSPASQARIISGSEEGTFGWVTANYVSGRLGGSPPIFSVSDTDSEELGAGEATLGALDLGGASTQITFYTPADIPADYREDLDLYGANYTVYTHSYLCYGVQEAIRRYKAILVKDQGYNSTNISNPCGFTGKSIVDTHSDVFEAPCAKQFAGSFIQLQAFDPVDKNTSYVFEGTANETECVDTVKQLFNFSASCPVAPCTFNGVFQPPVFGQFYAFSSFFYEMSFLNLTQKNSTASLNDFTTALSTLCSTPWDVVQTMKTGDRAMLPWFCFEGHFIHTLLTQAYGFNSTTWQDIHFILKINKTDLGWSLGYMLNSSNTIAEVGPRNYISYPAFSALVALFGIFLLLAMAFACYARRHQQRKSSELYDRVPKYGAVDF